MSLELEFLQKLQKIKQQDVEVLLKKAYRGIWETAIKKYSDSAHFIYELLQNADDAKATWVEFDIEESGLFFKHNGSVRFTISNPANEDEDSENGKLGHINSITSIGNSTKIDEQKIGKFGIGFKAVFAYSATPHIYDDNFNFKLENYIVPIGIDKSHPRRKKDETLFYFPFNHKTKSKKEAYNEIEEKLETLFQPILFLSNIEKIKWVSSKKNGEYIKRVIRTKTFDKIIADYVEVISTKNSKPQKEYLWLFSQNIIHSTLKSNHKLVVGFFVLENNTLETGYSYEAFCFFPTKEDTKLGFIIQAPFLLTDSREGIKAGDNWNVAIMQLTADLAANAIVLLKQLGEEEKTNFITDSILDIIPYKETDFGDIANKAKISFKPFYNTILQNFKTEQLLPGTNGKFYKTQKAYWASDPELAELFSDEQISQLMENPNSGWVFTTKGQKQLNQANKQLEAYISSIVNDNLDPKKLLRRITASFIENQSDEWLLKFYVYLGGRKSLWDDKDKLAIKKPILLNQVRKAVVPFNDSLTAPNIFIPSDRITSYDTIYKPFVDNIDALEFFKGLGLGKADLRAEIYKTILPQYNEKFDYKDIDTLLKHFDSFLLYYESCPISLQDDYLNHLRRITFIAARKKSNIETRYFCTPNLVYFNNEKLKKYFDNYSESYMLDEDFYKDYLDVNKKEKFINFLHALGLSSYPRIIESKPEVTIETKEEFALDHYEISITHYDKQSIIDKNIQGLQEAVNNITLEKSIIIWDYLLYFIQGKNLNSIKYNYYGIFNFIPKGNSYSRNVQFESTIVAILRNDAWIYNKEGIALPANQLTAEAINDEYNLEDVYTGVLLEFLGIVNPDADLDLTDEQKAALNLGRKLIDEGITQDELNEFISMIAARKRSITINNNGTKDSSDIFVDETEIDEMISTLKKGIKKNRIIESKPTVVNSNNSNIDTIVFSEIIDNIQDQDEYIPKSVDYNKQIDKEKNLLESRIENITRIAKLNEIANTSEKYSYAWFKALLELEYLASSESNSHGKEISIQFSKVEKEADTERTLILKHPNRYIPQSIEDIGDLQIRIYEGAESKSVTVEVVSVKEYTLRAKLKKSVDISDIDLSKVSRVVIDVKNPVFILEELRKSFYQLNFEDDYNLQQNLTKQIRFIFGPPGTGKTTYLAANEIIPLMKKEEDLKVLVLTPTNKAADVLTKRIIEKMEDDETYYNWLLRFGTTADADLENSSLVVDKNFDIRTKPRNTTITTIARFAYDYFQPDMHDVRFHLKFLEWDYIIIDEASMVTLASIAYVLYQKPETFFIIAGDPFQIQPITQVEQWKDMNIYNMVQLDKFVNPVTSPHQYEIINLKKQYRAIPTIGNVFSHFTYNGTLEHHRTESEQKDLNINGLEFKDINIIKFQVSKYESIYRPNTLNGSHYQIYSGLFIVEFVSEISKQIQRNHKDKFRIGVICPYKAQATLIEKLLSQQHNINDITEILIGTIHGFQGDECDIILAIFNPPYKIGRSPNMFLNKQNILNVSISRARDYLFVIMPDDNTEDVGNLYKIKTIEKLIHKHAAGRLSVYKSEVIEEKMFGSKTFIYDNSFATTHQSINVYSKPDKKYEVRCEEIAIDVQVK